VLLDPTRLIDDAFEDPTHELIIEMLWGKRDEPLDHFAFTRGVVDGHGPRALEFRNLQDKADSLGHQRENLRVDGIDR